MGLLDFLPIGGSVVNAVSNGIQNRKDRKFQNEQWEKTNAYNTPLEQRKRMEAAGFNPNLVYGHGTVANTAQGYNVPDSKPLGIDILGDLQKYQNIKSGKAQTAATLLSMENMKAQNDAIKASTELTNQQANKTAVETDNLSITKNYAAEDRTNNKAILQANKDKLEFEVSTLDANQKMRVRLAEKNIEQINSSMSATQAETILKRQAAMLNDAGINNAPWYVKMFYSALPDTIKKALNLSIKD
jgi:hypothetical protein